MGVSAQVAPSLITGPNTYFFTEHTYYANVSDKNGVLTVRINPGNPGWLGSVGYVTEDGTAVAGVDYVKASGVLTIGNPAGANINVPLLPSSSTVEKTVNVRLVLVNTNEYISQGAAVLVIRPTPPANPPTNSPPVSTPPPSPGLPSARAAFKWQVSKATVKSRPFNTGDMLELLANSFNMTFPSGAQIVLQGDHLYVVDRASGNIVLDPSSVVSLDFVQSLASGLQTAAYVVLSYNDSATPTADGTHTQFDFSGLWVMKAPMNLKNQAGKVAINFQGAGRGAIRNQPTIITGTIIGSGGAAN
jgi:hypothetical protein